jgi:predicted choloylglycine hydrolase
VVSDRFELTNWFARKVIAKAQRPWGGCLDGMNEDGLVASMTFGGNAAQGRGFSIILMLRYVLETCDRVPEAVAALTRIPIAQSQNVTLLDRSGAYATLFLRPDRAPAVSQELICTNHQETITAPTSTALAHSIERQRLLAQALDDPAMTSTELVARLLRPPLHSRRALCPTVYTAVYRPSEKRVDYLWPGKAWRQGIDDFACGEYTHAYGALIQ